MIVRFAVVGVINVAVDAGGFALLVTKLDLAAAPANVISFSAAIITSYTLNSLWTFGRYAQAGHHHRRFGLFIVINLIGLTLSTELVLLFIQIMDKMPAKIASIPLVFVWNYCASKYIVFRSRHAGSPEDPRINVVSEDNGIGGWWRS